VKDTIDLVNNLLQQKDEKTNAQQNAYDAVIIGAGIGGLVCGCYLARAGMKVLICEQHYKPGDIVLHLKDRGYIWMPRLIVLVDTEMVL